jgi:hypothetical protein
MKQPNVYHAVIRRPLQRREMSVIVSLFERELSIAVWKYKGEIGLLPSKYEETYCISWRN